MNYSDVETKLFLLIMHQIIMLDLCHFGIIKQKLSGREDTDNPEQFLMITLILSTVQSIQRH